MIALLWLAGCADGLRPVLISIDGATYDYDVTGEVAGYAGINVEPGETLDLRVRARHTTEIRFANLPGLLSFDPSGTTGTLEVFDGSVDTGSSPEAVVTLWNAQGDSRDFPVLFAFPRDTGVESSSPTEPPATP